MPRINEHNRARLYRREHGVSLCFDCQDVFGLSPQNVPHEPWREHPWVGLNRIDGLNLLTVAAIGDLQLTARAEARPYVHLGNAVYR